MSTGGVALACCGALLLYDFYPPVTPLPLSRAPSPPETLAPSREICSGASPSVTHGVSV